MCIKYILCNKELLNNKYMVLKSFLTTYNTMNKIAIKNTTRPENIQSHKECIMWVVFYHVLFTNERIYGHQGLLCGIKIFQSHHTFGTSLSISNPNPPTCVCVCA